MMERSILDKTAQTKRKIQYVAKSTYVVSLPKQWVRVTFGDNPDEVKKKSLVIIPMQNGSLTIYPEKVSFSKESEATLRLDDKEIITNVDFLKKRLISKYLAGYRRIRLTSQEVFPPEMVKNVEDIVRLFIGCEIVEINPNIIVIQDLLALGQLPIRQALNMMSLTTRSATKSAIHALVTQNETMAREVANLEDKVDQYHYLITRQLNSVLANPGLLMEHGLKLVEVIEYQSAVQLIERISDHAERIAKGFLGMSALQNFETISEGNAFVEILSILKDLNTKLTGISKKAMDTFFSRDAGGAYKIIQSCSALEPSLERLDRLSYEMPLDFTLKVVAIADSIARTAEYLIAICELAMDRAELS